VVLYSGFTFFPNRFLEQLKETMTVTEMRDNLRSTGAITGTVRMVPLSHILIFKYKVNWHELVNASQVKKEDLYTTSSLF